MVAEVCKGFIHVRMPCGGGGQMLASGIEPCAPRPNKRICRLSAAEVTTPVRQSRCPDGKLVTCCPSTTSRPEPTCILGMGRIRYNTSVYRYLCGETSQNLLANVTRLKP